MFEHVHISARRDRLHEIRGNQLAPGGRIFRREAGFGRVHAGFESQACPADAGFVQALQE